MSDMQDCTKLNKNADVVYLLKEENEEDRALFANVDVGVRSPPCGSFLNQHTRLSNLPPVGVALGCFAENFVLEYKRYLSVTAHVFGPYRTISSVFVSSASTVFGPVLSIARSKKTLQANSRGNNTPDPTSCPYHVADRQLNCPKVTTRPSRTLGFLISDMSNHRHFERYLWYPSLRREAPRIVKSLERLTLAKLLTVLCISSRDLLPSRPPQLFLLKQQTCKRLHIFYIQFLGNYILKRFDAISPGTRVCSKWCAGSHLSDPARGNILAGQPRPASAPYVKAMHILSHSESKDASFFGISSINDCHNGIFACSSLEKPIEDRAICFIYDPFRQQYHCMVLDPTLKDPARPVQVAPSSYTFERLNGKVVFQNSHPYRRLIGWHARAAYRNALKNNWITQTEYDLFIDYYDRTIEKKQEYTNLIAQKNKHLFLFLRILVFSQWSDDALSHSGANDDVWLKKLHHFFSDKAIDISAVMAVLYQANYPTTPYPGLA
ncbi:hypothetical protein PROFUN_08765 [Planoprotostelium fungivorum]|uniref:HNH nuclease domain-containing protein n=1 Tax=Planoprotostelium fungivorum TaxID=1890364 RepID=A0A2P6MVM8_9EUKA|nr:hypothetical protein PROFUN_08765 [Planoprotostelium fungivorum]